VRHVHGSVLRSRRLVAGICSSALFVSLLAAPAHAPAATPCSAPPATFPVSQMHAGMTGVGHTVIKGTTVEQFDVEVLGVLPDYIFLGIDIIVMRMTGPADLVETTGGAVAGMSGSPVYINGKLAGALAWAVAEDRRIFGVTAAEDMVGIFDLEDATAAAQAPARVALSPAVIRAARASGSMLTDAAALESLPVPLGVSGLAGIPLTDLEETFAEHGMRVTAFRSGSAAAPSAVTIDPSHFAPGEGLGVALSYGDVSYYGFGTTTAVCGDVALGFGHPLFWDPAGKLSLGMTDVDVFAIDNGTFWGRKIGTIGDTHGVLTQDRFGGVAGVFGLMPTLVPITSDVSSLDTGLTRHGETQAAWDEDWFVADVAAYHAFSNFNYVHQSVSPGTIDFAFEITGTREDGSPFVVSNRWFEVNEYGAAYGAWRMAEVMYALAFNDFERIQFTGVDLTGTITEDDLSARIDRIRLSSPLQRQLKTRNVIRAEPGDRITVEVTLERLDGGPATVATLTLRVPRRAVGFQQVTLTGGRGRLDISRGSVGSFNELLRELNGGDHRNDLIARGLGRSVSEALDVEVNGRRAFTVRVVR
jgi:SpoIVB peptidase S55